MPRSLGEASEAIRLLQETITTLTEQARQLEATQNAGSNARALKKIRGKK